MNEEYDELVHFVQQMATQAMGEMRFIAFGNVVAYDPVRHMIRAALPTYRIATLPAGTDSGTPILTPWMQLGTPWAGNGWGFQAAPEVGDSSEGSLGTQCAIFIVERRASVFLSACLLFNNVDLAPDASLQGGEAILKHQSGTAVKFSSSGDLEVTGSQNITLTTASGISLALQSSGAIAITLPSGRTLAVNGSSDSLALVSKLIAAFNAHTHPVSGSVTGPPTTPWQPSTVQSALVEVGG